MKKAILALALTFSTGLFAQNSVPKEVAIKSFMELSECADIDETTFSEDTWSFMRGYVEASASLEQYMSQRMNDLGAERLMAVAAELQSIDSKLTGSMDACANKTTANYSDYDRDQIERSWLTVTRADVPDSADYLALIMEFAVRAMAEGQ